MALVPFLLGSAVPVSSEQCVERPANRRVQSTVAVWLLLKKWKEDTDCFKTSPRDKEGRTVVSVVRSRGSEDPLLAQ